MDYPAPSEFTSADTKTLRAWLEQAQAHLDAVRDETFFGSNIALSITAGAMTGIMTTAGMAIASGLTQDLHNLALNAISLVVLIGLTVFFLVYLGRDSGVRKGRHAEPLRMIAAQYTHRLSQLEIDDAHSDSAHRSPKPSQYGKGSR